MSGLKFSGVLVALLLSTSSFAGVDQKAGSPDMGNDEGLGVNDSELVQDIDAQPSDDPKQLSDMLLQRKIETAQAVHAGEEEIAEPVADGI